MNHLAFVIGKQIVSADIGFHVPHARQETGPPLSAKRLHIRWTGRANFALRAVLADLVRANFDERFPNFVPSHRGGGSRSGCANSARPEGHQRGMAGCVRPTMAPDPEPGARAAGGRCLLGRQPDPVLRDAGSRETRERGHGVG